MSGSANTAVSAAIAALTSISLLDQGSVDIGFRNDAEGKPTRVPGYVAVYSRSADRRAYFVLARTEDGRYAIRVEQR